MRFRDDGLICISPGAGTLGSLRLRFMRMLERRRAWSTSRLIEPLDPRRDSSFWMPAFRAAAAASECGGVCEMGGDCDRVREGSVGVVDAILECTTLGEAEGEGEGGSEFRSGGMALRVDVGEIYTMPF
jgi:hypothetical protein